jgi:cyclophilin family peptidyl-prolyl cis-trans isomerase
MEKYLGLLAFVFLPLFALTTAAEAAASNPRARLKTTLGEIVLELYADKAPVSVENFLAYAREGFFQGTVFHRVIPGFMIQGGGLTADLAQKTTRPPIKNEAANGLRNERGSVAMARTMAPDSATAQFFINVADNTFLNHRDTSPQGYGYAVFGRVVQGMEVVDKIVALPRTNVGSYQDVPVKPVVIEAVEVLPSK